MSCPHCGSWAVKADRSLGGRMVCGRCGEPLGAKVIPLRRGGGRQRWPAAGRGPGVWWLLLLALIGVSAALAALQLGEATQRQQPWERRGLGRQDRPL